MGSVPSSYTQQAMAPERGSSGAARLGSGPAVRLAVQDSVDEVQLEQGIVAQVTLSTTEAELVKLEGGKRTLSGSVATLRNPSDPPAGKSSWVAGVFHLVTVIIGAGVLALPKSFATLGWALAPALLAVFGAATVWSSFQLSAVFETNGKKHLIYKAAVADIMGGHHPKFLAFTQHLCIFLCATGYTLAGMTSIEFIAEAACTWDGKDTAPCPFSSNYEALLLFSGLQLILNVLPSLESVWWVSAAGAAMSYLYSALAVILSIKQLASDGSAPDSAALGTFMESDTSFLRAINMFGALGNVALAWLSGLLVPEIQATLKEPPKAVVSMRKTMAVTYASTGAFYFAVSTLGYAALGAGVPGNVLTGFSVSKEVELMANVAVLLHMVAAVQVYMQPLFQAIEAAMAIYIPATNEIMAGPTSSRIASRFVLRMLSTAAVTGVAYGLPYFSLISGLNGAVSFWPLQIGYPFAMHMKAYPPTRFQRCLRHVISGLILCACILATMGCLYGLATASS